MATPSLMPTRRAPSDSEWRDYLHAAAPLTRCADGCLAAGKRWQFDDSDGDAMTCYRCRHLVCVSCGRTPVDAVLTVCDACV